MRSRLTFSKPAFRASETARTTSSNLCLRPMNFKMASFADCAPMLMRLKPAARSLLRLLRSTLSGLASSVTSAVLRTRKRLFISSKTRMRFFAPNQLGVPPPK